MALNPEERGDKQTNDPRAAKDYDTFTCQSLWRRASHNPHASQAVQSRDQLIPIITEWPLSLNGELPRVLTSDMPRLTYEPRRGASRTIQHWGQRKLLLSEIEFLTHFGSSEFAVLYAGAAPGTHIGYLAHTLFPQYSFVLVDPNRFDVSEADFENVHIINDFFTSEMAEKFAHLRTLFISDIRTANPHTMTPSEVEVRVKMDNVWQERWHAILRPRASMLKFRLPYNVSKDPSASEDYLDGHAWLPVWGRVQTTETRLVSGTNTARRIWNLQAYEDQCYWFNRVLRPSAFAHSVDASDEGLDHCYDCAAEVEILRQYQLKHISTWMCHLQPEEQKTLADLPEKVAVVVDEHERACEAAGMTLSSVPEDRPEQQEAEGTSTGSGETEATDFVEEREVTSNLGEAEVSGDSGSAAACPSVAGTASNAEQLPWKPSVEHHRENLRKAVAEARALKCRDAGEPIDEVQQTAPTVDAGSTAPPLLPSLWHELDLDDEQRRLIDERVAKMVKEISRQCSRGRRQRSLAQITLPTEERGYRFDSNMEGRLLRVSDEASKHFASPGSKRRFSDSSSQGESDRPRKQLRLTVRHGERRSDHRHDERRSNHRHGERRHRSSSFSSGHGHR